MILPTTIDYASHKEEMSKNLGPKLYVGYSTLKRRTWDWIEAKIVDVFKERALEWDGRVQGSPNKHFFFQLPKLVDCQFCLIFTI